GFLGALRKRKKNESNGRQRSTSPWSVSTAHCDGVSLVAKVWVVGLPPVCRLLWCNACACFPEGSTLVGFLADLRGSASPSRLRKGQCLKNAFPRFVCGLPNNVRKIAAFLVR